MKNALIENIEKVHTTEMGAIRIKKNLCLGDIDVVVWCRERILDNNARIERNGKNWYVMIDDSVITVNASSYTIITAHKEKK
ncbi:DUF3781 domain-containing protein [Butyrivibrio sp. VCD2006]|uniref:DUF3781 domain-containing protein n=1 Tax=Butyrivibrio sp. VCD2006 TaxID=1280664 RepID=UPI00041ED489|nr:DUF3781 domain-containing protein [Butyrivibrio sp. VCD2006]